MNTNSLALARPLAIGRLVLRNRILMAPITTNYGDERGYATDRTLSFYGERAAGGAAAIVFEALSVNGRARLCVREHGLHDDSFIPRLTEVTESVHAHGGRLIAQLCHAGPKASATINGVQAVSASAVPVKTADPPRPISREEIARVIEDFAAAAVRARDAGFDGVELHACHFYLLSSFLSGYLNRRTDEYGGSVENRARLTCEVLRAVKARSGADFPVVCRIHGREKLPGGIDEAEAGQIGTLLEQAGADALHVSGATVPVNPKVTSLYAIPVGSIPNEATPHGCYLGCAARVKEAVRVPVIAVGKLNDPVLAEAAVRDGAADAVGIARGLVADPYLPTKVLEGRWDEIVRCTDCLTCHTTTQKQHDMGCSVNPKPWVAKGPDYRPRGGS